MTGKTMTGTAADGNEQRNHKTMTGRAERRLTPAWRSQWKRAASLGTAAAWSRQHEFSVVQHVVFYRNSNTLNHTMLLTGAYKRN